MAWELNSRFQELLEFGRGTTATVYKATRHVDGRDYAIKIFDTSDCDARERWGLLNEVLLLSALRHPHIVTFREAFVAAGEQALCVVMELMGGGNLGQYLRRLREEGAFLPEEAVWRLFLQLATAVHYLHASGICHRDLKPTNVMFADAGASTLKLVDFGLSKFMRTRLTNTLVGTPMYAAPEVFNWLPYGLPCDVWSLGCILHELAALEPAFHADSMRQLRFQVLRGSTTPLPPRYSQELRDTLAAMLQPDAAKRITMQQLVALPAVAARLERLGLQEGLALGGAAGPRLQAALSKLEGRTPDSPRFGRCLGRNQLAQLLPSPRYSAETLVASQQVHASSSSASSGTRAQQLHAALASSFYVSSPGSSHASAATGQGSTASAAHGSSQAASALSQAAVLSALHMPSPLDSPTKPAEAASKDAGKEEGKEEAACATFRIVVDARGAASPTAAQAQAASAPSSPQAAGSGSPGPVPTPAKRPMPKVHPKYAHLVAAAEEAARRASMPGVVGATADASQGASAAAGAAGSEAASSGQGSAAGGSPAGRRNAAPFRRARASSPGSPLPANRSSSSTAAFLRAAVIAGLQADEALMIRQLSDRLSRLGTPSSSAGPTPRAAVAAALSSALGSLQMPSQPGTARRPPVAQQSPMGRPRPAAASPIGRSQPFGAGPSLAVQPSPPSCPAMLRMPSVPPPVMEEAAVGEVFLAPASIDVQQPATAGASEPAPVAPAAAPAPARCKRGRGWALLARLLGSCGKKPQTK